MKDAFVGFQSDTPASVLYQATNQLQEDEGWPADSDKVSEKEKKTLLKHSKKILLQMASPDALIRLRLTGLHEKREKILKIYYFKQHHGSVAEFFNHHRLFINQRNQAGLLLQVSNRVHGSFQSYVYITTDSTGNYT